MAYVPQRTYYKISVAVSSVDSLAAAKTLFDAAMVTALAAANLAATYPAGSSNTNVSLPASLVTTDNIQFAFDGTAYNLVSAVNYSAIVTPV